MVRKRWWLMLLCLYTLVSAANTNDFIHATQIEGTKQAASVSKEKIQSLITNSAKTRSEHTSLIDGFLNKARATRPFKQQAQAAPNAVLFVSFSMPESLLFALCDEAERFNIPVVLNGLVENDFKKTIQMFARLHRDAQKQHFNVKGLSIDPLWFQQFQITAVPALVLSERPASCEAQTLCENQRFDVVCGNASIKNGLELIRDKGEVASGLAKAILEQGHV